MEALICANKKEWDEFILQNSDSFLQSYEWGEFQEKMGKKAFRLQITDNGKILLQGQLFTEPFSFKKFLYIPYGPIFLNRINDTEKHSVINLLINKAKEIAKKENCVFLKIEPVFSLGNLKGKKPFRRLQPQKTLVLDLTKSEEDLQKDFKQKTRQNINFAIKNGVTIKKEVSGFSDFFKLMKFTEQRQDFGIHSEKYYKNILEVKGENIKSELFLAEYRGKIINAIITMAFGKKVFTLHGGSDYNFRHFKGANLIYWEIISDAKNQGYKEFDFWGIDEKKWPGVTIFKKGFGGNETVYPDGVDIVFNNFWYYFYKIIRAIKSKI